MSCPCKLSQVTVVNLTTYIPLLVGADGLLRCGNAYADGSKKICNNLLADHSRSDAVISDPVSYYLRAALRQPVSRDHNFLEVFNYTYLSWSGDSPSHLLYKRSTTTQLWDQLWEQNFLVVNGSPGIGKAISVWAWLCDVMSVEEKYTSALWINTVTESAVRIADREIMHVVGGFKEGTEVGYSVLVLDALEERALDQWFPMALRARTRGCKVVLITSGQVWLNPGEMLAKRGRKFNMQPWTLAEYHKACEYQPFFASVVANLGGEPGKQYAEYQRRELVQNKYEYSGYSARWTFNVPQGELLDRIMDSIGCCSEETLKYGIGGCRPTYDINQLVFTYGPGLHTFVSAVVCRRLAMSVKCTRELISAAYQASAATGNISFEDWILQMDLLYHIRSNLMAGKVRLGMGGQLSAQCDDPYICTRTVEFTELAEINESKYPVHCWFIPKACSIGGFDAAQFRLVDDDVYTLRFIQIARANQPTVNLKHMRLFARAYNAAVRKEYRATAVEIAVLAGTSRSGWKLRNLAPPKVSGTLLPRFRWSSDQLVTVGFIKTTHPL